MLPAGCNPSEMFSREGFVCSFIFLRISIAYGLNCLQDILFRATEAV